MIGRELVHLTRYQGWPHGRKSKCESFRGQSIDNGMDRTVKFVCLFLLIKSSRPHFQIWANISNSWSSGSGWRRIRFEFEKVDISLGRYLMDFKSKITPDVKFIRYDYAYLFNQIKTVDSIKSVVINMFYDLLVRCDLLPHPLVSINLVGTYSTR